MHEDERAMEELREAGADLAKPRPLDHYAYFPSRGGAQAFADEVRARNFVVAVREAAEPGS
jgi:hypothetical protein